MQINSPSLTFSRQESPGSCTRSPSRVYKKEPKQKLDLMQFNFKILWLLVRVCLLHETLALTVSDKCTVSKTSSLINWPTSPEKYRRTTLWNATTDVTLLAEYSRPHTRHISRLLAEPPAVYFVLSSNEYEAFCGTSCSFLDVSSHSLHLIVHPSHLRSKYCPTPSCMFARKYSSFAIYTYEL